MHSTEIKHRVGDGIAIAIAIPVFIPIASLTPLCSHSVFAHCDEIRRACYRFVGISIDQSLHNRLICWSIELSLLLRFSTAQALRQRISAMFDFTLHLYWCRSDNVVEWLVWHLHPLDKYENTFDPKP